MWRQTCENGWKEESKETSKAIWPMRAEERVFSWSKVKVSGLHILRLDMKRVKGRKEGKDDEIKGEAFGHLKEGVKMWSPREKRSPSKWDWGLVQSWRTVWVRVSKREEKNREGKRKYTMRKRAMSEKRERESFFFTQVVSLSVVISIWYSEIIRSLSPGFSLLGERVHT